MAEKRPCCTLAFCVRTNNKSPFCAYFILLYYHSGPMVSRSGYIWRCTMNGTGISMSQIEAFCAYMRDNEKAEATVEKYRREILMLRNFLGTRSITKDVLLEYRDQLLGRHQTGTVNGKLSAVNAYLVYAGLPDLRLKILRVQRKAFIEENRELTEDEYRRLLKSAKDQKNERLYYLIMTIAGTGIRISELKFITVEAANRGCAEIRLKGKTRMILLPDRLGEILRRYARRHGIKNGCIFCTRNGRPLDRSNICHEMKKLCKDAEVEPNKVFPHNLRHLFARVFYNVDKNLAHLADILGHSSIETTRIYVAASVKSYEQTLRRMRLVT